MLVQKQDDYQNIINKYFNILLEQLKHFFYTEGKCNCKLCIDEKQCFYIYEEETK